MQGAGRSADTFATLGGGAIPLSAGCRGLVYHLAAGMPRMAVGVTAADREHLAVRSIWEASPAVSTHLQRLPAPVAGVGATLVGEHIGTRCSPKRTPYPVVVEYPRYPNLVHQPKKPIVYLNNFRTLLVLNC